MSIGHFIGRRAADVVHFFRGRQAVPCTVDWEGDSALYFVPVHALADPNAPTVAELNAGQRIPGVKAVSFNMDDETCCGMCDNGCWDE